MTQSLFDVRGRVVIVTGGGRGIGRVYCEAFAQAGMRVVLADIHAEEAERAAAAIRASGGAALALRTDISLPEDAQAMAEAAASTRLRFNPLRSPADSAPCPAARSARTARPPPSCAA